MNRSLILGYGLLSYAIFFATFLYALGFIFGFGVPTTLDKGVVTGSTLFAIVVNTALLMLFALQHSVMARPAFKRWITRYIPQPLERPTYVLASSVAMGLLMALWAPMPQILWSVETPLLATAIRCVTALGFLLVLYSTFLIDHFDLFGLRQVVLHYKEVDYTQRPFGTPGLYKFVRHPIYLGWSIAFWATPTMTLGHLLFAAGGTAYMLVAIIFEERDLIAVFGDRYRQYRTSTPALIPTFTQRDAEPVLVEPR